MKLQTPVTIPEAKQKLDHSDRIVSLGSCFAEEIGKKCETYLFDILSNPLGTVYNPLAANELINRALNTAVFREDEFFQHLELWRHFLVQDKYASTQLDESKDFANSQILKLGKALRECSLLIVTLGSSWIYRLPRERRAVAYNHRLPLKMFNKELLRVDDLVAEMFETFQSLKRANPCIQICLTVSPVRHLRDGLHENNVSKSVLLLSSYELERSLSYVHYFPAYEILMDELRDYRFFAEDLAHPNQIAIDYIWEQFSESFFSDNSIRLFDRIHSILQGLKHRPRHTGTRSYRDFRNTLREQIKELAICGLNVAMLDELYKKLPAE